MTFTHEENRIYYENNGKLMAEVTFPSYGEGIVAINRTYVDSLLRGQGIASMLMQAVCDDLQVSNRRAKPVCSYAIEWFAKNENMKYLLNE